MYFDTNVWGTVAEWVGGLGTTLAFGITALVVFRDAKVRRESQARKIAYYLRDVDRETHEISGKYTKWWDLEVHNLSDEPIYRIQQHNLVEIGPPREPSYLVPRHNREKARPPHRPRFYALPRNMRFHEVLLPGEKCVIREPRFPSKSRSEVHFVDNSGRTWVRMLNGSLRENRPFVEFFRDLPEYMRGILRLRRMRRYRRGVGIRFWVANRVFSKQLERELEER